MSSFGDSFGEKRGGQWPFSERGVPFPGCAVPCRGTAGYGGRGYHPGVIPLVERDAGALIGRAAELAVLDRALAAARRGRTGLVVVSGEAGIGKTRFCAEVAARARRLEFTVASVGCWAGGGAPPLWPWHAVVTQICGQDAGALLDGDGRGARGSAVAGAAGVDPERFSRFRAIAERIAAACRSRPTLLVIDDLHAAQAGALLLLRFVMRSHDDLPLVALFSRRTGDPDDPEVRRLLDELVAQATVLPLAPFDVAETAAFLVAQGAPEVNPAQLPALLRVTGGNPLFLRRVATLSASHRATATLPDGVRSAISEVFATLGPGHRRILAAASVLGLAPTVRNVTEVAPAHEDDVRAAIGAGRGAGLVEDVGPHAFSFTHQLVREAIEATLPARALLDAHKRAADVLTVPGATPSREAAARGAHHALAAAGRSTADARRAVAACATAAREMVGAFAYEQAASLLESAVRVHEEENLGAPPAHLVGDWAEAVLSQGGSATRASCSGRRRAWPSAKVTGSSSPGPRSGWEGSGWARTAARSTASVCRRCSAERSPGWPQAKSNSGAGSVSGWPRSGPIRVGPSMASSPRSPTPAGSATNARWPRRSPSRTMPCSHRHTSPSAYPWRRS